MIRFNHNLIDALSTSVYYIPSDCHLPSAILGAAGISAGGSLLGGICGASASEQASSQQVAAEEQALQFQQQVYQANTQNLTPYMQTGTAALPLYAQTATNIATQAPMVWSPTGAQLAETPGYQFTLGQALGVTKNALSAIGTGAAGTTGPGPQSVGPMTTADYATLNTATGLASQTYNQQYQNWLAQQGLTLQQQQQQLSASGAPVQTGLQAAGALAGVGVQSANQIGTTYSNIGSTQAAGTVGTANALTSGLTGATSAASSGLTSSALLPLLLASGGLGSGAGTGAGAGSAAGAASDAATAAQSALNS
jgi:hypothetical protein